MQGYMFGTTVAVVLGMMTATLQTNQTAAEVLSFTVPVIDGSEQVSSAQDGLAQILSEEQYAKAYRDGFNRTVRFLLSSGVQSDLAEEIAQAAWARGWECRAQLKNPAAVGVWVNTIAKNLVRVDYRRKKATEELEENSAVLHPRFEESDVNEILSHCSEVDRELLKQHYMEGWSSNEIAPRLGISPVSVRVRLLRIKQNLRQVLNLEVREAMPDAA